MAWTAITLKVLDQILGFQGVNEIIENAIALARAGHSYYLGGSRNSTLQKLASVQDAPEYVDVTIDGTDIAGFTVQAEVQVRAGAATAITPKVRNITAASDAGTGVSATGTAADYSGTNQQQTISVTLATGSNVYRLQGTPANTTDFTYLAPSELRVFATA